MAVSGQNRRQPISNMSFRLAPEAPSIRGVS
jgi:hypothetical protein